MGNKELIAALRERADGFESFNPDAVLLKRAANALEAQEWRDIESAPKDGTPFLAFAEREGWKGTPRTVCCAWYKEARKFYIYGAGPTKHSEQWLDQCSPTHWKPLTPPETE